MPNVDALLDAMGQVEDAPQDPRAVSPKGARGLYQIMPDTGKQYGVDNPDDLFDPKTNRSTAKKIVTDYAKRYDGDPRKILQAYNAGPGRVKSGMVPKETHSYVDKVLRLLGPSEASAAEEPDADYWGNATVPGSLKAKPKADTQPAEPDADYWAQAKVPDQPEMRSAEDSAGNFTAKVALGAQRHLKQMGVSDDWAEGVGKFIENAGPHSVLEAVLDGVGTALGAAEFTPEAAEAIPYIGKAIKLLKAPGLKGTAARVATQVGAGGIVGGPAGAMQGVLQGTAGEIPGAIGRRVTGVRGAEQAAKAVEQQQAAETVARDAVHQQMGMTQDRAMVLASPNVKQEVPIYGEGKTTLPATGKESGQESTAIELRPSEAVIPNAQQLSQTKRIATEARSGALHDIGRKYNPLFQSVQDKPLTSDELSHVSGGAVNAKNALRERGYTVPASVQKHLDALHDYEISGASLTDTPEGLARADQILRDSGRTKRSIEEATPQERLLDARATLKESPREAPTIGQLRGRLSAMMAEANNPSVKAPARAALMQAAEPITEILNNAIPDEAKPVLDQINAEYAQLNQIFPFKQSKQINDAATLPELGETMFSKIKPSATNIIISRMTPAQKSLARDAFASWMLTESGPEGIKARSTQDVLKMLSGREGMLQKLGFSGDLAKVGTWYDLAKGARAFHEKSSSAAQKEFMDAVRSRMKLTGMSTPEVQEAMDDFLRQGGAKHLNPIVRYASTWGALGALGGYGVFGHQPELAIPIALYAAGSLGYRAITRNPALLPIYRQFMMNGWTRAGGDAFARFLVASVGDIIRHQLAQSGNLRPDIKARNEGLQ